MSTISRYTEGRRCPYDSSCQSESRLLWILMTPPAFVQSIITVAGHLYSSLHDYLPSFRFEDLQSHGHVHAHAHMHTPDSELSFLQTSHLANVSLLCNNTTRRKIILPGGQSHPPYDKRSVILNPHKGEITGCGFSFPSSPGSRQAQ